MNIVGEIEGRTAIIIDDIIDTGTITLAQALKDKGAKDVYACCTHQFYQVLLRSVSRIQIKELIVTNSILLDDTRKPSNTKELSVADYLLKQLFEYMNVNQ